MCNLLRSIWPGEHQMNDIHLWRMWCEAALTGKYVKYWSENMKLQGDISTKSEVNAVWDLKLITPSQMKVA